MKNSTYDTVSCKCNRGYFGDGILCQPVVGGGCVVNDSYVPCSIGTFQTVDSTLDNSCVCQPCGANTYNPIPQQTQCVPCFTNSFTSVLGATSILNCSCVAGYFRVSASLCQVCPTNTYRTNTDPDHQCIQCPSKTFTASTGSVSIENCGSMPGFFTQKSVHVLARVDVPADQYSPDTFETFVKAWLESKNPNAIVKIINVSYV